MSSIEVWRDIPPPEKFQAGYDTYLSPFTYRYGSKEMRQIWSQQNFWQNVRNFWVTEAQVQNGIDKKLVSDEQLADLKANQFNMSVERIFQIEQDRQFGTGHDIAAAILEFQEVAPIGGAILSQGNTSEDPLGYAQTQQILASLDLSREKLVRMIRTTGGRAEDLKNLEGTGWTHMQAAEPVTYGYRIAKHTQDLFIDLMLADNIRGLIKGKGIKGAVGTSASFVELLDGTGVSPAEHEKMVMDKLEMPYYTITDQTPPRKILFLTAVGQASMAQSLHRLAFDIQLLQSSSIMEVSEARRKGQKGSSAMPHKQNPIGSENVDALTELLPGVLVSAWIVNAFAQLERSLKDSAGTRVWLPEHFLIVDEALDRSIRLMSGLRVHENAVAANLAKHAPFMASEPLLSKLQASAQGRMDWHDVLADISERAMDAVRSGKPNPMQRLVLRNKKIRGVLSEEEIRQAFGSVYSHVGDAPERVTRFLQNEVYPYINKTAL